MTSKSILLSAGHSTALADRFASKVTPVPESGCWLWTASWMATGYGQINVGGRPLLAHRVSWELSRGEIPDGLFVCHKCDTRACVNPGHLFLGSAADNSQDMRAKGRQRSRTEAGEKSHRAKITDETARLIFEADGTHDGIARRFGVNRVTVGHIKLGKQWNSVTGLPKYRGRASA